MNWYNKLSTRNKIDVWIVIVAFIAMIVFGNYIDNKFTSYSNMDTGSRYEETNK